MTKTLALAALILAVAGAPTLAFAQDSCSTQATDKKLAGAAKTSFMKKCVTDFCMGRRPTRSSPAPQKLRSPPSA